MLDHIEEGMAYHDGEARRLYDPNDANSVHVAAPHCLSWSVGPLTVQGCVDFSGPSISVKVTLAGVTIGSCTIDPSNPNCTIGGGVLGFKAEVRFSLVTDPIGLKIEGELCAPFAGCKTFSTVLPFPVLEDAS